MFNVQCIYVTLIVTDIESLFWAKDSRNFSVILILYLITIDDDDDDPLYYKL